MARVTDDAFFGRDTLEVARSLLGATLSHRGCGGTIVEVEAYKGDPASHYVTRPRQGAIMGTSHGRLYVYSIYGIHLCLNFTTDTSGPGAVLLRALAPTSGVETMRERRGLERLEDLCSGPGKLVQALGVAQALTGERVLDHFEIETPRRAPEMLTAPRIGISVAQDLPWRFCVAERRYLSRPLPDALKRR